MIQFFTELPEDITEAFPNLDEELTRATSRFFVWREERNLLAVGGEMLPCAIGNRVYIWLRLQPGPIKRSLVFRGMHLVSDYLRSLPWTPFAECALNAERNERFLLCCGFEPVMTMDDRVLYRWSE